MLENKLTQMNSRQSYVEKWLIQLEDKMDRLSEDIKTSQAKLHSLEQRIDGVEAQSNATLEKLKEFATRDEFQAILEKQRRFITREEFQTILEKQKGFITRDEFKAFVKDLEAALDSQVGRSLKRLELLCRDWLNSNYYTEIATQKWAEYGQKAGISAPVSTCSLKPQPRFTCQRIRR